MSEPERTRRSERPVSAEAVGTLIWLLDEKTGLDRRRFSILSRLRAVSESDQFDSLPDALREKVRQIIADSEG